MCRRSLQTVILYCTMELDEMFDGSNSSEENFRQFCKAVDNITYTIQSYFAMLISISIVRERERISKGGT